MKIGESKQFECEGEGLEFSVTLTPQDGDPNTDMGEVIHCPFCGGEVTPKRSEDSKIC